MAPKSIHWKVPTTMFGAWIAGILLIFGHHTLNHNLHGKPISIIPFEQKVITFAGTALAFMVKTCFALAASTAYIQIIWNMTKRNETRMGTLDSAFNAVKDISALSDFSLWLTFPLVTFLALSLTLLPIPSVITPASLAVASVSYDNSTMRDVPFVDFTSLNFASITTYHQHDGYMYQGPQYPVQQVVTASLIRGEILPIQSVETNASWSLEFAGPALDCSKVTHSERDDIMTSFINYTLGGSCTDSIVYMSWNPTAHGFTPYYQASPNSSFILRPSDFTNLIKLRTFFAVFPVVDPPDAEGEMCAENVVVSSLANATIISCSLYNTTYRTAFSYLGGRQEIISTTDGYHNEVNLAPTLNIEQPTFNETTAQNYAYQSVWSVFNNLLVGFIHETNYDEGPNPQQVSGTSILTTVLSNTNETFFLGNPVDPYPDDETTWQEYVVSSNFTSKDGKSYNSIWNGTWVSQAPAPDLPLFADSLEEAFKNATISLISAPSL